ncbi:hypothetical protein H6F93_14105 [Leptolyngbya sp. FACHB-671]|uniref:hypothetical protein n=1 Tax=Leptolyngbya sp. FACHB-671 TaxID=2692812 RepID=UPI001684EDD0|nr:hypothetical protein [Leptolyngbya sp. FACHB-671]MBD2068643.1 hypothetical protein [Leptolyngbya sp. FACHB-671]
MLKILLNARWQLLQFTQMRDESLLELSKIASWGFRVNSLIDITVEGVAETVMVK